MKKICNVILLIVFCFLVQKMNAQHSISLETESLKKGDSCALYTHKNGMPLFLQTKAAEEGRIVLKDTSTIVAVQGVYVLMLPPEVSKEAIPVLYSEQESKNIEMRYYEHDRNIIYKNSPQNGAYLSYIQAAEKFYNTIHNLEEDFLNEADTIQRKKIRRNALSEQEVLYEYGKRIGDAYRGTLLEKLILCLNIKPIPDMAWEGEHLMYNLEDAKYQDAVNFIRQHYWEGVDFSDNTLTKTPYLSGKTTQYISLFNIKDNKNIVLAIDELLQKAAVNADMYHVIEEALLNLYVNKNSGFFNEEMGIRILRNEQKQSFTPDWRKEIINSRISFIEKNKLGSIASDLTLEDQKGIKKSLLKTKSKYTILYFFNPDCSHCMQVSPIVKDWLSKEAPKDVLLMAVYVDNDEKEWHKYVTKNNFPNNWLNLWGNKDFVKIRTQYWIDNIPSIYLLDENKKVLLKDVNYKQLFNYFNKK